MSSARIFNCVLCHRQVIICSCCDRGNIYCGSSCSKAVRKESLRAAGKRYQSTYQGKLNNAKRQRCYRERQRDKTNNITHHGSIAPVENGLLQIEDHELENPKSNDDKYCHFCGCKCEPLLRIDYLRTHVSGYWPFGP